MEKHWNSAGFLSSRLNEKPSGSFFFVRYATGDHELRHVLQHHRRLTLYRQHRRHQLCHWLVDNPVCHQHHGRQPADWNTRWLLSTKSLIKPRVNFINVFTSSFYACRSQKRKKLLYLTVFLVLLGSARVKAAHKMLVKLTAGGGRLEATFYARYVAQ